MSPDGRVCDNWILYGIAKILRHEIDTATAHQQEHSIQFAEQDERPSNTATVSRTGAYVAKTKFSKLQPNDKGLNQVP